MEEVEEDKETLMTRLVELLLEILTTHLEEADQTAEDRDPDVKTPPPTTETQDIM